MMRDWAPSPKMESTNPVHNKEGLFFVPKLLHCFAIEDHLKFSYDLLLGQTVLWHNTINFLSALRETSIDFDFNQYT